MKGFYWGNGRVRCSFCHTLGHNITTCKLVDQKANIALQKISANPSYICNRTEHEALCEIKRREERKAKARRKRKKPQCSFCKSYNHKRPNCPSLQDFREKVYAANKNWKRILTQRINETGLGVGCLIQFDPSTATNLGFDINDNRIAMITDYSLGNLNVFCGLADYSRYQSNDTFTILSGDKSDRLSVKFLGDLLGYDLLYTGWWYHPAVSRVLSKMEWEPDENWLNSEWDEVLDWFFSDVDLKGLQNQGIAKFIDDWINKI